MLVIEVLVIELFSVSIDALATGAVTSGEVTTLGHEAINDTVELAALVAEEVTIFSLTLLASAESSEVLRSLRSVTIQLHNNSAGLSSANRDIEVDIIELLSRCCFLLVLSWCWGAVAIVMAEAATATDATEVKAGLRVGCAEAAAKVKA